MKTDKISFGTKPVIGEISAHTGLTKYKRKITYGIYDAFQQLSKNNADDELYIIIGMSSKDKNLSSDLLELSYWNKVTEADAKTTIKSSLTLDPKYLEKLSKKVIVKKILDSYELLKGSNKQTDTIVGHPLPGENKPSKAHKEVIEKLKNEFGFGDLESV